MTTPGGDRLSSARLLLCILLLLYVAPVWGLTYFATRDGPAHLEGALTLLRYGRPGGEVFTEWLVRGRLIAPNWLDHGLMALLLQVVPPLAAEKVVITLAIAGLPLSAYRAFEALRPGAGWLAVLAVPFGASWLLHMGFYNFCLGLALFFLAVGSAAKHGDASWWAAVRLFGWATALYVAHPMPLLGAAILVPLIAGWRRGPRAAAVAGLAFLPALGLLAVYLRAQRSPEFFRFPLAQLAADLGRLDVLVTFVPAESVLAVALSVVLGVLAVKVVSVRIHGTRPPWSDALLVGTAAFTAVYFTAPVALFGGTYLTPRLMVFPCFGLLLWLATFEWTPAWRRCATAAGAVLALGLLAARLPSYRALDTDLQEFATAAPWIDPGTVVLALRFAGPDERTYPRIDCMAHAAAYVASERKAIDLTFYEGTKRGQFPLEYRFDLDPYRTLGGNPESIPPCVDIVGFTERTSRRIDYVLTWRQLERDEAHDCAGRTLDQIRDGYDLVYSSPSRRLVKVWRRKP